MWDLHTKRDINLFEGVQNFALRVCFKVGMAEIFHLFFSLHESVSL